MTTYEFRYKLLVAPEPRTDGSGVVAHDIEAEAREAGSADTWGVVPGRHKTILTPGGDLQTVIDMAGGAAKVAAYKQLLVDNLNTVASPVTGWTTVLLQALLDANDIAAAAATGADNYITVDLGLSYPVPFVI